MSRPVNKTAVFGRLPPVWADDPLPSIRAALAASRRKLVILDDDPTGTQTVRDLTVVTCWDVATLRAEFEAPTPGFFILTNSRSLVVDATRTLHEALLRNLIAAAQGRAFTVISRSDSTLRGHFPAETDMVASILGAPDLLVLAPYFDAGGRYTIDDVHYVAEGETLTPAAATPFARDAAFGYEHSDLRQWVEEKTLGLVTAAEVHSIPLALLRTGGPDAVERALRTLPRGSVCVVNACAQRDIEVFAAAALRLELAGLEILYRTAASFVAARFGQSPPPPLDPAESIRGTPAGTGGLIIAGSYVPKTTAQLERLRAALPLVDVGLEVAALLDPTQRDAHLAGAVRETDAALLAGRDVLVATSRSLVSGSDAGASLAIGRSVSDALIALVQRITATPRFLVAKGGITSSDIATGGLGVRRAHVLGQLIPGVPVWRLGAESRFPGMAYVVFPGNVGDDRALAEGMTRLAAPTPPSITTLTSVRSSDPVLP
jgi:uncharacterized protein YgbK (DUF1537 family)